MYRIEHGAFHQLIISVSYAVQFVIHCFLSYFAGEYTGVDTCFFQTPIVLLLHLAPWLGSACMTSRPSLTHTILARTSRIVSTRLSFRTERSREAYVNGIERKMSSAGLEWEAAREFVPGKRGAGDGYQLSCGMFKMHVLEHER